jgi:hypothetical protein
MRAWPGSAHCPSFLAGSILVAGVWPSPVPTAPNHKEDLMNRICSALLMAGLMFAASYARFPMEKHKDSDKPAIVADPSAATLVIMRETRYAYDVIVPNYVDGAPIGMTKRRCYFVTKVTPGLHWVSVAAITRDIAKITFEAGKVYYLRVILMPGPSPFGPACLWDVVAPEFFQKHLEDMVYLTVDPEAKMGPMAPAKLEEDKADFEKKSRDEPARVKNILEYRGY